MPTSSRARPEGRPEGPTGRRTHDRKHEPLVREVREVRDVRAGPEVRAERPSGRASALWARPESHGDCRSRCSPPNLGSDLHLNNILPEPPTRMCQGNGLPNDPIILRQQCRRFAGPAQHTGTLVVHWCCRRKFLRLFRLESRRKSRHYDGKQLHLVSRWNV